MPSGNWHDGVTYASRAPRVCPASTTMPSASTGTEMTSALAAVQARRARPCTGIFHPRLVTRIEQHVRNEIEATLRAGHDLHLVRFAAGAARLHLLRNRHAQCTQSGELRIIALRGFERTQALARELRPDAMRKQIERRSPEPERTSR